MRLTATASFLYDAAVALLYPRACAICAASVESHRDGVVCAQCWSETRRFSAEDTLCWKCGAFSHAQVNRDHREQVRCGGCDEEAFTAARACGYYEGALRATVLALKREPQVAPRLAELMWQVQRRHPLNQATIIIPVPLHPERERERGFNQAAVLARELGRFCGLPLDEQGVVRRLHTERHRAGMDARARRESVADAFAVLPSRRFDGEKVLLVDDVFTSGATASACATVLKASGASDVFVLTVARPASF